MKKVGRVFIPIVNLCFIIINGLSYVFHISAPFLYWAFAVSSVSILLFLFITPCFLAIQSSKHAFSKGEYALWIVVIAGNVLWLIAGLLQLFSGIFDVIG